MAVTSGLMRTIAAFAGALRGWALVVLVVLSAPAAAAEQRTWVLVDTATRTLSVVDGTEHKPGKVLASFSDAALGRGGVTQDHLRGDGTTPLGTFTVAYINRDSRFEIFFGLDFPTIDQVDRAYRHQLIDRSTYGMILDAMVNHRLPPLTTPLGGAIGIHGLGKGDPLVHRYYDWTDGCIALTNQQITDLARWMRIGTTVVIR